MALISPNARHPVKILRNVLVAGKGRVAGEVVEVDEAAKRKLIGMGLAVAHTPVVQKLDGAVEKTVSKLKGK